MVACHCIIDTTEITSFKCLCNLCCYRYVQCGQNPDQSPYDNLPDAAATYAVGGMATHWTAATPREHPTIERSKLLTDKEWGTLYKESEALLKTNHDIFNSSIRNTLVKDALLKAYPNLSKPYQPQNLPLAVEKNQHAKEFVTWTGSDTILGKALIDDLKCGKESKFQLKVSACVLSHYITIFS